ncbi:MAG: chloride channel protein [Gemmatimonadales bacterium]
MMPRGLRRTWTALLRRIQRDPGTEDVVILGLAVLTGLLGALAAAAFYQLVALGHTLFVRLPLRLLPAGFDWLYRPLLTGAAFALAAWFMRRLGSGYEGMNIPDVAMAVASRSGRLPLRPAAAKTLASSATIAGGGSAGSEGPIAVLGAVLGSQLAQRLRLRTARTRVLVGAGAAAGIAAAFNTPLAGAFFALEEILSSFSSVAFAPVVVSSITASLVSQALLGTHPAFTEPLDIGYRFYREILLFFPLLGLAAGVLSAGFVGLEDRLARSAWRRRVPHAITPWLGGALVGVMVASSGGLLASRGHIDVHLGSLAALSWHVAILLAVGKVVVTAVTLNSGGSGGVFAPSLFAGALLGTGVAGLLRLSFPTLPIEVSTYTVVGMGAVLAAATGAPITGTLFVFELTRDYRLMLPLLLTVVVALAVRRRLVQDTLYTSWLRRTTRPQPLPPETALPAA